MAEQTTGTSDGRTHWEGCWRDRGHHECAVAEVERLRGGPMPNTYQGVDRQQVERASVNETARSLHTFAAHVQDRPDLLSDRERRLADIADALQQERKVEE